MVTSDWGDWLPAEIEAADPDDGMRLWYLGCNGFALTDGPTTILIDPYLGTGDPPRTIRMIPVPFDPTDIRADAILATHEHSDHVHGPSQAPILANGADFYGPRDSVAITREWDVSRDSITEIEPGTSFSIGDFDVQVTAANDPDAESPVGYLIRKGSRTFYHGGDARPGEAFERVGTEHDVDCGALAFGSVGMIPDKETGTPQRTRWYSDEADVVEAATQLRLDRLLPTHWDMWKGLTADPHALHDHARSFDYPRRVEVLEIGDTTDV